LQQAWKRKSEEEREMKGTGMGRVVRWNMEAMPSARATYKPDGINWTIRWTRSARSAGDIWRQPGT